MLIHGANANAQDKELLTPLMWAVGSNRRKTVDVLLHFGADANARDESGETPLMYAVRLHAAPEVVRLLLGHGASMNARDKNGSTVLYFAMISPCAETVHLLLECGAEVNATDRDGWTPLYAVLYYTSPEKGKPYPSGEFKDILLQLLAHGANPNLADKFGKTPFSIAQGHPGIVALLRQAGARK